MSWAIHHINSLKKGETVMFRPFGNSMKPLIESGDLVTVEPITPTTIFQRGDIVLCRVKGNDYLHLITHIANHNGYVRFQIGNNQGRINGWIYRENIFGKFVKKA